eukprot:787369-Prorocentrum_minimum.AAC.1
MGGVLNVSGRRGLPLCPLVDADCREVRVARSLPPADVCTQPRAQLRACANRLGVFVRTDGARMQTW